MTHSSAMACINGMLESSLPSAERKTVIQRFPRHAAMICFSLSPYSPQNECLYSSDIPAGVRYLHIKLVAKELPAQVAGRGQAGAKKGAGRESGQGGRVKEEWQG